MYERNAIVIDRYFANMFSYYNTNNIKNNSNNYFELVNTLENYQQVSEAENNIMQEFEKVAKQIKETQKLQEVLNKKNLKYNENIKSLFESLDEEPEVLNKKFEKLEEDISRNNEEIKINSGKFVEEIKEFNEKSEIRNNCGRERRVVESDYQRILSTTIENINKINKEKLKEVKAFIKSDDKSATKEEIKEKILKNGSKEKVPFDENVINAAINVSTDIEVKKAEILLSIYDKTTKLLAEIKNDTVKIDKHKKLVRDAKSKLELLDAISEYLVLFLDNERMNTMGGENEHQKIMSDACDNLQQDLIQIQNMYSLLVKEMTGKSSKKAYKELYNPEYVLDLQDDEKQFEKSISKLNMMGTIIYPDYWRVEGMQKLHDTFKHLITDVYEKDLSEYEPIDISFDVNEDILNAEDLEDAEDEEAEDTEFNNEEKLESNESQEHNETTNDEDLDEDVMYEDDIENEEELEEEEEEEFQWDDDDEDDELTFGNTNYILDKNEYEEKSQEDDEEGLDEQNENEDLEDEESSEDAEAKRDKEIDEILGFFDDEDDIDNEDESILPDEDDEVNDLADKIFDEEEDKKEKEKGKEEKFIWKKKKIIKTVDTKENLNKNKIILFKC